MGEQISNFNYLAPTGFKITVSREFYPHLQYFAQQVQHPSIETNAQEVSYKSLAGVTFPAGALSHGTVTMDILMDENMESYKEMYDWQHRLMNDAYAPASYRFTGGNEEVPTSANDIRLTILTSANNSNKEIIYRNALPTSLGDVQFASTSAGEYITFPVSFRFDYFDLL